MVAKAKKIEELKQAIAEQKRLSDACEERNYHKLQYSNPYDKEMHRLQCMLELTELEVPFKRTSDGFLTIRDKFEMTFKGRWRQIGRGKWYWYKSMEDFATKYT